MAEEWETRAKRRKKASGPGRGWNVLVVGWHQRGDVRERKSAAQALLSRARDGVLKSVADVVLHIAKVGTGTLFKYWPGNSLNNRDDESSIVENSIHGFIKI
jgi:hypothetical protein